MYLLVVLGLGGDSVEDGGDGLTVDHRNGEVGGGLDNLGLRDKRYVILKLTSLSKVAFL